MDDKIQQCCFWAEIAMLEFNRTEEEKEGTGDWSSHFAVLPINSTLPVDSKNPSERVGNRVPLPSRIAVSRFFILISHLNIQL